MKSNKKYTTTAIKYVIYNVVNGVTKEPVSLLDIDPAENNKDIYKFQFIQNAKIEF